MSIKTTINSLNKLDHNLTNKIVLKPTDNTAKTLFITGLRRFSETGSYGAGWVILFALVGITNDGIKRGLAASLAVLIMLLINTLIKNQIKRPRPTVRAIDHAPKSWSMPSAHTSMAMVGAATISVMLPHLSILWWAVAIFLAASRVMLGMHYLGDVLVGAILGVLLGLLVAAPIVSSL